MRDNTNTTDNWTDDKKNNYRVNIVWRKPIYTRTRIIVGLRSARLNGARDSPAKLSVHLRAIAREGWKSQHVTSN